MSGYDFRDACEAGDLDKVKGKFYLHDTHQTPVHDARTRKNTMH